MANYILLSTNVKNAIDNKSIVIINSSVELVTSEIAKVLKRDFFTVSPIGEPTSGEIYTLEGAMEIVSSWEFHKEVYVQKSVRSNLIDINAETFGAAHMIVDEDTGKPIIVSSYSFKTYNNEILENEFTLLESLRRLFGVALVYHKTRGQFALLDYTKEDFSGQRLYQFGVAAEYIVEVITTFRKERVVIK